MVSVCQLYLSFYFGDEFVLVLFVLPLHSTLLWNKNYFRECCPPLPLLPETSNDTSVIHTFHSTHLSPTNTTNASQVLQTQQHEKNKSTAGFPVEVVTGTTFYIADTLKGANQTRLQRCLKRLVEIQTQKSKQTGLTAQGWAASKTPQNHMKYTHI